MKSSKTLTLREFERSFGMGEPIYVNLEAKRVQVNPPVWATQALNREATRLGVPEQDLINIWLIDRLDRLQK